jgi:hypothetical protein
MKKILSWIFILIVLIGIGSWIFYRYTGQKSLKLVLPKGKEIWQAGKTYQITWKARNIQKVGITLIKDKEPKESEWIVKDFPAGKKKYDWQIFAWQEPRQDYKIAIIEYPWQEGNKISYSEHFTILGPQFASCDSLSIEAEWPYLPSDFPDLKKVFITESSFTGNLEGLEGADQKCQSEAENKGWQGTWKAFLGDDTNLAVERLNLEGIFVEAEPAATVPEEKTCHRLLGKNFDEFLKKLSNSLITNQGKLGKEFSKNLENIWLGRIDKESKRECIPIFAKAPSLDPSLNYSFTTTCQNWTTDKERVEGYPPKPEEKIELPICYTPEGVRVNAAALAGLSLGIIEKEKEQSFSPSLGKTCNLSQKLLCIQQ